MAMFARASRERWNPGTTTISGAGLSLLTWRGLNRSPATHWPFCVGMWKSLTRTAPPEVWIRDETTAAMITNATRASNNLIFGLFSTVFPGRKSRRNDSTGSPGQVVANYCKSEPCSRSFHETNSIIAIKAPLLSVFSRP